MPRCITCNRDFKTKTSLVQHARAKKHAPYTIDVDVPNMIRKRFLGRTQIRKETENDSAIEKIVGDT